MCECVGEDAVHQLQTLPEPSVMSDDSSDCLNGRIFGFAQLYGRKGVTKECPAAHCGALRDGGEIVASLQSYHDPPPGEQTELTGHVAVHGWRHSVAAKRVSHARIKAGRDQDQVWVGRVR